MKLFFVLKVQPVIQKPCLKSNPRFSECLTWWMFDLVLCVWLVVGCGVFFVASLCAIDASLLNVPTLFSGSMSELSGTPAHAGSGFRMGVRPEGGVRSHGGGRRQAVGLAGDLDPQRGLQGTAPRQTLILKWIFENSGRDFSGDFRTVIRGGRLNRFVLLIYWDSLAKEPAEKSKTKQCHVFLKW